jgi:hypothetical protein
MWLTLALVESVPYTSFYERPNGVGRMTKKIVRDFKFRANLFESKWDYTRTHHITSIRYEDKYDKFNTLSHRIKRAFECLYQRNGIFAQEILGPWGIRRRISFALHVLKRDPNLPDGSLGDGKIITFWEEDGEYLQLVQPSVGCLLADFLEQEPENPHAILIIKEMERIDRAYSKRLREEKK